MIKVIYTDEEIEARALNIFRENISRKGLSYTDAVTVAVIEEYGIDYLLSYDIRSFHNLVENIIGVNYWNLLTENEQKYIQSLIDSVLK